MRLAVIVVAAFVLASCGSSVPNTSRRPTVITQSSIASGSASSSPTASLTPPSPTPTSPATWTLAQAGKHYLAYAAQINVAVDAFDRALPGTNAWPPLPKLKSACAAFSTALHTFASQLGAGMWPPRVMPQVNALIAGLGRQRGDYQQCADASDDATAQTYCQRGIDDDHGESEALRAVLGLPGTPGSTP